ncbi:cupin domain-containing protein [Dactylosporangium vinaceum]|uniref:Cupin domain-containing protein n=1 Tax=Dactylosporangium vinaceum TaxID=53362 RepID=A0ABV5M3U5_9ACTN|nr:cupin domain-containing protein [Dactylosporangium vinaceum]UAB93540.1 cupin domain-containing protein [Dactylosporangium vinaceum]
MRTYQMGRGPNRPVGDVDVFRWDDYEGVTALPFRAMWYQVPAGGQSPEDKHPELELSIVVQGDAAVSVDGREPVDVRTGDAFLLESGERHVVHNRRPDEPLVVFSAYWHDPSEVQHG